MSRSVIISRGLFCLMIFTFILGGCECCPGEDGRGSPGECMEDMDCMAGQCCLEMMCQPCGSEDAGEPDGDAICPPGYECGTECCTDDEECVNTTCRPFCPSGIRCGPEGTCCEAGGLCMGDECLMPGGPCSEDIECPEGYYCDPEMGRCIPRGERRCEYHPPSGTFTPVEQWRWTSATTAPSSNHVMMTPVVGDINVDGIPDVVVNTYSEGQNGPGILRVLRGDTGEEIITITSPTVCATAGIALGDLDGDGRPEIVTGSGASCSGGLIAFHNDGSVAWESRNPDASRFVFRGRWGAPAIADLEGDGRPEIVFGAMVFESDGTLRWDRGLLKGVNCCDDRPEGPVTAAYDVDADGQLEVVSGNAVWEADGSVLWERPAAPDGFVALADFFDDDQPDLVVVHGGMVSIRHGRTGEDLWGPAAIPGGGRGGPPTVADFDNDDRPEIGVGGRTRYVVFDVDGASSVLWSQPIEDESSNITGSSVFDFDGDGNTEVVYNDECFLRVYQGNDGTVLAEIPQHSHTIIEYPIIVDVDGDGNAEIVFAGNARTNSCSLTDGLERAIAGVRVLSDDSDNWVGTRTVWNQHTYHITNILSDLSVPSPERPNWRRFNNFRQNTQNFDAPDLSATEPDAADGSCVDTVRLRALIMNQGSVLVPPGLPVTFYQGTPDGEHSAIATVMTDTAMPPGVGALIDAFRPVTREDYDMEISWFVRADDRGDGTGIHNECDETNNVATSTFLCLGLD